MSCIELVIKIPEDEYHNILHTGKASFCTVNAVEAGTILPKGHGRLIDAELLDLENLFREDDNGFSLIHTRSEFQTIIEADTESEE